MRPGFSNAKTSRNLLTRSAEVAERFCPDRSTGDVSGPEFVTCSEG